MDGKATLAELLDDLRGRVEKLTAAGVTPGLGTVLVGDDPGSHAYVRGKHRDCAKVGMTSLQRELPADASQAQVEDTIDEMSTYAASWVEREPGGVTVAIGTADEPSRPLSDRLAAALSDVPGIDDVLHYRVGPSVGAHTGPGTFGLFVFPTIR